MTPKGSPLDGAEWALMREQVATITALTKKRYGQPLDQSIADLEVLQRLLDDHVYDETDTEGLRAIGSAVGNVIEKQLAFEWVALDDGDGRQPGLRLKTGRPVTVFPQRMIVRRIENGEPINLAALFKGIKADVAAARLI